MAEVWLGCTQAAGALAGNSNNPPQEGFRGRVAHDHDDDDDDEDDDDMDEDDDDEDDDEENEEERMHVDERHDMHDVGMLDFEAADVEVLAVAAEAMLEGDHLQYEALEEQLAEVFADDPSLR